MTETVVTVENAPNNNTAKPNEGNGLSFIKLNVEYFKTLPGIIKIIELILGIICMSCASPAYLSGTHWFLFAVTISFISTLIWSFVYLLSIREALNLPIDWLLSEMGITGLFTVFYLLAFVVQISIWSTNELVDLLHLPKVKNIIAGEMINTGIDTVFYCIGFIVQLAVWVSPYSQVIRVRNLIAGVFGLLNTFAYGYGTFMLHKEWKSSRTTN